jgi:hypothetical protein
MNELEALHYDIEQLWIEGKNPVEIAGELDCHIDLVHAWMAAAGLKQHWDHYSDLPAPAHYDNTYDPHATINS